MQMEWPIYDIERRVVAVEFRRLGIESWGGALSHGGVRIEARSVGTESREVRMEFRGVGIERGGSGAGGAGGDAEFCAGAPVFPPSPPEQGGTRMESRDVRTAPARWGIRGARKIERERLGEVLCG